MLGGLIAAAALAAVEPTLSVEPLGPARPDGLVRVQVAMRDAPEATVSLELRDGSSVLAEAVAVLPAGGGRAVLVLAPSGIGGGRLHARAVATWPQPGLPPRSLTAEAPVATPSAVFADAVRTVARLRASGADHPLPWLWAEEIAELGAAGASAASIGEMAVLDARLRAWLADPTPPAARPGVNELALRDPVDGSVQPLRLHLPAGAGPHPLLVLLAPAAPAQGKARWPHSEPRLVDTALAAGVAVVECYAAGDRAWAGAARRRIALAIAAAARAAPLDRTRGACLGTTTDPTGLPYALHRPPADADAAWCRGILAAALPTAAGGGWADAPFVLVVGGAEHAAAAAANRRLAASFRAAYAAHAHAVLEPLDDRCDAALLAGRNLVLVGNPRSNRVLAALAADLPWRWDHREAVHRDGTRHLRASQPFLAMQVRLPDGRLCVVIDGPPPEWGDGLPLGDLR